MQQQQQLLSWNIAVSYWATTRPYAVIWKRPLTHYLLSMSDGHAHTYIDWNAIFLFLWGSFVINAAAVWRPQFWRNFFHGTIQTHTVQSINPYDDHQTISVNNRQPEMMSTYKKKWNVVWMDFYVNSRVRMCLCRDGRKSSPFIRTFEEWSTLKKCRFFDRMIINYSNLSSRDDVAPIYVWNW